MNFLRVSRGQCLVIGEITNETLIVVLNKIDTLPEASREQDLDRMKARIQKTLSTTKFADAPLIGVAARPGGIGINCTCACECARACTCACPEVGGGGSEMDSANDGAPLGIAKLIDLIRAHVRIPKRDPDGPLLFAIDHCFPSALHRLDASVGPYAYASPS